MSLWKRSDPNDVLVFPFPPASIADSRNSSTSGAKTNEEGQESAPPIQHMAVPRVTNYDPRQVSFSVTFDDRAFLDEPGNLGHGKTAHGAMKWLREQQAPQNSVDDPSRDGQPPVLVLSAYDIFECILTKVSFDVDLYNPYTNAIMAVTATLTFVQYVAEEVSRTLFKGFGGGFDNVENFNSVQQGRRNRKTLDTALRAFSGIPLVSSAAQRARSIVDSLPDAALSSRSPFL